MVRKFLLLNLSLSLMLFASTASEGVKLHLKHYCVLKNGKPFQNGSEYNRFEVSVDPSTLPDRKENIQQIALWSDGKLFVIQDFKAKALPQSDNLPYGPALGKDELKYIENAHFTKLKIRYEPSVDERQSAHNDTTPYFTLTKTTVEKEEFLPIIVDRQEIDQVIKDCDDTIQDQKNMQRFSEIMIALGISIGLIAVLYYLWRRKKEKSVNENIQKPV